MLKYILKRLGLSVLILLGVSLIIYFLVRLMPVDFIQNKVNSMPDAQIDQSVVEQMYKNYGLGDNSFSGIISGYWGWLKGLFNLDFGISFKYGVPVTDKIIECMPTSFFVALIATIFEFMIAIPLGITAATHQYSIRDYIVTILVMIGISLPSFFFGQMLKDLFALKLGLFPVSGSVTAGSSSTGFALVLDKLHHWFIPILTSIIITKSK